MSFPNVNYRTGDAVVGPPVTSLNGAMVWVPNPGGFDAMMRVNGPVGKFVKRSAEEIKMMAKSLAPVDTGALRDSIEIYYGKYEGGIYAEIGTDTYYAPFQEFGTVHHAAHPFLRPALMAVMESVIENRLGGFVDDAGGDFVSQEGRFDWNASSREWDSF